MKPTNLVESFNRAFVGLAYCFKTQRNMKLHFMFAILVLLAGVLLNMTKQEIIILTFVITLVLATEIINTACELMVDLMTEEFSPIAKIIKDISAGAVLIASISAVVVGYLIFSSYVYVPVELGISKISNAPSHITFICFASILFLAILSKLIFKKGTPLRGGMPSVHSAVAFAIWTITSFVTKQGLVIFLVFLMAVMIAQARVYRKIHTLGEVIIGGVLGILISVTLFQIFG